MLRESNCQPKIQHPDKLPFNTEGEIKVLFKEKLGFFIIFIIIIIITHKSLLKELQGCTSRRKLVPEGSHGMRKSEVKKEKDLVGVG